MLHSKAIAVVRGGGGVGMIAGVMMLLLHLFVTDDEQLSTNLFYLRSRRSCLI